MKQRRTAIQGVGIVLILTECLLGIDFVPLVEIPNPDSERIVGVEIIGDVNGDGLPDFAVAVSALGFPSEGKLTVFDSFGDVIYELSPPGVANFARSFAMVSDHNNDGLPELLVGVGGWGSSNEVWLVDSATGETLLAVPPPTGAVPLDHITFLGLFMADAGDVNGDGIGDFIFSSQTDFDTHFVVSVHSGLDGTLLHWKEKASNGFGFALAGLGDTDGDGYGEFLIGDGLQFAPGLGVVGGVTAYSGETGEELWTTLGQQQAQFGSRARQLPDMDGDGISDVAVSALFFVPGPGCGQGKVYVLSGVDGTVIEEIVGCEQVSLFFGGSMRYVDNPFGDGADFLLITDRNQLHFYSFTSRNIEAVLGYGVDNVNFATAGAADFDGDSVKEPVTFETVNPGGGQVFIFDVVETPFIRGDVNGDEIVALADAIALLTTLFLEPVTYCRSAADVNADTTLGIVDAVVLLSHLFVPGSPEPEAPFPACGVAQTSLSCDVTSCP